MHVGFNVAIREDREVRYGQWAINRVGEMIASAPDPILQTDALRIRYLHRLAGLAGKGKPLWALMPSAVKQRRALSLGDLLSMCYAMKLSPIEFINQLKRPVLETRFWLKLYVLSDSATGELITA